MGNVKGNVEGLGSGARSRIRIRFMASCMGRIVLWLESDYGFNVRMLARLTFRVTLRCG